MDNSTTLVASTIKGMHHVGIAVSDVEKSVEFYQSVTALKRIDHDNIAGYLPEPCEKSAVLKGPNGYLQLMQFAGPTDLSEVPVAGPGVTHLCLQSPAEDALFNNFINNGAKPVSKGDQPIDLNGQGVRYGYARDADNIMFEIEQLDQPRFEGSIWIAHIALVTPDLDQSVAFYRNLLGVETYGLVNKVMGERFDEVTGIENVRIRVAWFNTGNMVLEIWEYVNPKTPHPGEPLPFSKIGYNKIALEVDDLEAELSRLKRMGVECLNEPEEINGITEVYFRDPDGNLISLLKPNPSAEVGVTNLEHMRWLPSPSNPTAGK